MMLTHRLMIAAGAAAFSLSALPGMAGAWEPQKPIELVIMAGKGGGADKLGRFIQEIAEENGIAKRPLVPVNKDKGSGAEALEHMTTTDDPDHMIMVTLNSFFTLPIRQPELGIDIMTFAPVARMAQDTFLLWVHKDEGVTTFEEFLAEARKRGGDWVMGGTGTDAEDSMITDFLNGEFGLSMTYTPYKGGGAVAKELAGRQITSSVNNPSEALGFYESGDLIPLVAFTDERLPQFPDTPTLKELGTDYSYFMQRSIVGAPGMSAEALAYYQAMFAEVYASQRWQDYMEKQSLQGPLIAGEELKAYWKMQLDRHEKTLNPSSATN